MYYYPYNNTINYNLKREVEKLNRAIEEEKKNQKPDNHKIMRLRESILMNGLFSEQNNGVYGKYKQPW